MNRLTASQVQRIQEAAEEILSGVGVRIEPEGILKEARAVGARVDEASGTVRLPSHLLRASVPEHIREDLRRYFAGECRKLGGPTAREKRET